MLHAAQDGDLSRTPAVLIAFQVANPASQTDFSAQAQQRHRRSPLGHPISSEPSQLLACVQQMVCLLAPGRGGGGGGGGCQ